MPGPNIKEFKATPIDAGRMAVVNFPPTLQKPKLLDQVRQAIRTRHYSARTEETYVHWIKRFIFFHNKRHPVQMGEKEIARFLSNLEGNYGDSIQQLTNNMRRRS